MSDSTGHRPDRLPAPAPRQQPARQQPARQPEPAGWDWEPADPGRPPALRHQRIALVDLLDRVLAGGVVIMGEVRLAIADVDLVTISLQALVSSVSTAMGEPLAEPPGRDRPAAGDQARDR